jgi:hypothetical protein
LVVRIEVLRIRISIAWQNQLVSIFLTDHFIERLAFSVKRIFDRLIRFPTKKIPRFGAFPKGWNFVRWYNFAEPALEIRRQRVKLEKCVVDFVPKASLFCSRPSEAFLSCIMSLAVETIPAHTISRQRDFSFTVRTPYISDVVKVYTGWFFAIDCKLFH